MSWRMGWNELANGLECAGRRASGVAAGAGSGSRGVSRVPVGPGPGEGPGRVVRPLLEAGLLDMTIWDQVRIVLE